MKKLIILALTVGACALYGASTYSSCFDGEKVTDVYNFKMKLGVPRIYDNTTSLGYRKYQWQLIQGEMHITYYVDKSGGYGDSPIIEIKNLVNMSHKINGRNITYKCSVNNDGSLYGPYTRVNVIGSNKTGVFKQASVAFYMDAEPSYNVGEDDEDNSLLITLGGYGQVADIKWYPYYCCGSKYSKCYMKIGVIKALKGYVAGTLGCGCKAYGHKSPTRVMGYDGPSDVVDDVASVFGQWKATYKGRL